YLHGPAQLLRRQRRDHHVGPGGSLAPEAATYELRDHPPLLGRDGERVGELLAPPEDALGRVIDGEAVAVPDRERRVGLERIVRLRRRAVLGLDAVVGLEQRRVDVSAKLV